MSNKTKTHTILGILLTLLTGCDVINQGKEKPTGQSSLMATIQDSTFSFIFKNPPSQYFGISTIAYAEQYEIYFYISNFDSGSYNWQSDNGMFGPSPLVKLNNLEAVKEVGKLHVTKHNHDSNFVFGTFECAVLDSITTDTVFIRNGSFRFYYVNEK
ncbi:MAG TPA: hypothetical protein VNJ29_02160 [Candidatus Nitrosotenuis sp.]|nr:hypothetical protein [Candidatus Nitrosotenuis sp.]